MSFWSRLGVVLGSLLDPLGRPNRAKIGPRGPQVRPKRPQDRSKTGQDEHFYAKNMCFQKVLKNLRKNNDFAPPGRLEIVPRWPQVRPRWPKDRSKTAPRPPQDDLQELRFASSFSSSILVRFGSNLGSICPPLGRPRRHRNRPKKRPKITLPQDGLQDRSKTAPDPLQGAPRPPGPPPHPSRVPLDRTLR